MEIIEDEELEQALRKVSLEAETAQLRDFTSFSWDTVYVFHEGESRERVNEKVGARVLRTPFYLTSGNLLVFSEDGTVVRAIDVVGANLTTRGGGLSEADNDAWLVPMFIPSRPDERPVSVRLLPTPA